MNRSGHLSPKKTAPSVRSNNTGDSNMKPVTSPSPSLRHISQRRVLERQALLDRNYEFGDYLALSNPNPAQRAINRVERNDDDSIVYKTVLTDSCCDEGPKRMPSSGNTPPVHTPTYLSEYFPSSSLNVEHLEWKDILPYYLPFLSWINQYCFSFFVGDLIAGLSLVFFQLPLSLSYASSLAHVPVICGLYSLAVSPLVYMVFGSVPQMIVGPEAAILLIVGQAVEPLLHHYKKKHLDPIELVVAISFVSGASLLGFGLGRFGFLDNVLSGSLLKGFISGVGIVMVINSSIVMLGLTKLLEDITDDPSEMDIHSPFDKMRFLFHHYSQFHLLTFKISVCAFIVILVIRVFKNKITKRNTKYLKLWVYIPEILIVVIASTWLCAANNWDKQGIEIIGKIHNKSSEKILHNPISLGNWQLIKKLSTSGFLCAMLGFFESTTALKSLGSRYDLPISSNRELVAMGAINIFGSIFGALPAFGGYGRSKINAISAKTTMLGAIMGLCTILTISYLLDYLYYVPKCILSVITAVIGFLLIDEAPHELWFHWKSKGYNELITFGITVITTLFFSMEAGIAVGLVYLLIRVIKHSTESRIQILGRIPGSNTFVNADISSSRNHQSGANVKSYDNRHPLNMFTDDNFTHLNLHVIEEIEGCLIVKIPEPLTFTNTSDLRSRLRRVELYGSAKAHPAQKRTRDASMTKYTIFDLDGMVEIDSSAAQILKELISSYTKRGIFSFFVRVNKNERLRFRFANTGITDLLIDDLESIKYLDIQERISSNRTGRNRNSEYFSPSPRGVDSDGVNIRLSDMDDSMEIYNLTESPAVPFFQHISDVLKVIDYYEINHQSSSDSDFLEVDQGDRRSSLPTNELV